MIRLCAEADIPALLAVLNQSAVPSGDAGGMGPAQSKPVPPALDAESLKGQMSQGLRMVAWEEDGQLAAVAGLQDVEDVTLMRHGRVAAAWRGKGLAARLLQHLWSMTQRPVLTAIWAADEDAVLFCERHGFHLLPRDQRPGLLAAYWRLPAEAAEDWVLLADESWLNPPRARVLAPAWAASGLCVAVMLATSWAVGSQLPEGARLPIHWGLNGKPNGYGSPAMALLGLPILAAGLSLLMGLLPLADRRLSRSKPTLRAYRGLWLALLAVLALVHGCILAAGLGSSLPVARIVMGAVGALLAFSGRLLGQLEPNRLIGIRTPATLRDPALWARVHRGAAPYFYAHGGVLALAALLGAPAPWLAGILVGGLAMVTLAVLGLALREAPVL